MILTQNVWLQNGKINDTCEFEDVFRLFTTVELVIAAGALFNRLMIAALLFNFELDDVPGNRKRIFIIVISIQRL